MKTMNVIFTIPTGFIGADIYDERVYDFDDDLTEDEMLNEVNDDFEEWLEDILEDMRMSAEVEFEEI